MPTQALALRPTRADLMPTKEDFGTAMDVAAQFLRSGLLPKAITSTSAALLIMEKGIELGLPPTYALSNINIISGKPVASSELMLALIYRDHGDDAAIFEETTNDHCTISYKRRNASRRSTFTFSLDDAKAAGLLGNATWTKYPAAMCRARCVSGMARIGFPDTIAGMYTPEELGGSEDEDGMLTGFPVVTEIVEEEIPQDLPTDKRMQAAAQTPQRDTKAEEAFVKEQQVPHAAAKAETTTTRGSSPKNVLVETTTEDRDELVQTAFDEALATPEITGAEAFGQAQEAIASPAKVERPSKAKKAAKEPTPIRQAKAPAATEVAEPAVFAPLRAFLERKKSRADASKVAPAEDVQWFLDSFDAVGVSTAKEASDILATAFGEEFHIGPNAKVGEAYAQTIEKWIDRATFLEEIKEVQAYLSTKGVEALAESTPDDEDGEYL